jgi:cyclase
MLKTRIIPVLLLKDGNLVRSEGFSKHQFLGDPVHDVIRLSEWGVDELIYIDITGDQGYGRHREDLKVMQTQTKEDLVTLVGKNCFMPLTFGGGLRTLKDIATILEHGADKVIINTILYEDPLVVRQAIDRYGSQAIVACIDARLEKYGSYRPYIRSGSHQLNCSVTEWAKEVEKMGVGEIVIQSIDRDGSGTGFDLRLISSVVTAVEVPVIALGGAGDYKDFANVVIETGVSAVAAANIFHFREMSEKFIKRAMSTAKIPVRLT